MRTIRTPSFLAVAGIVAGCGGDSAHPQGRFASTLPAPNVMEVIAHEEWLLDRPATQEANAGRPAAAKDAELMAKDNSVFVATFQGGTFKTVDISTHYTLTDAYIVLHADAQEATLQMLAPDGTAVSRGIIRYRRDLLTFEIPTLTLVFKKRWGP